MTHISSLPFEVLITIMKWVVSSDLDLRSLEQCSEVCRGFYLASRSNDVWKPVCLRTWGFDKIPNDIETTRKKNGNVLSWRQFYLTRPRVQVGLRLRITILYVKEEELKLVRKSGLVDIELDSQLKGRSFVGSNLLLSNSRWK
jgi:hypothetical protein